MASTRLPTLRGSGLLLLPDEEPLQVRYEIPRRQKLIPINEANTAMPGPVELRNGKLVVSEAGNLPDNTLASLQLADGTHLQIVLNRRVKSTPPTYEFAIWD